MYNKGHCKNLVTDSFKIRTMGTTQLSCLTTAAYFFQFLALFYTTNENLVMLIMKYSLLPGF